MVVQKTFETDDGWIRIRRGQTGAVIMCGDSAGIFSSRIDDKTALAISRFLLRP